jgi:antitoxin (DNA-binding transcriptional repressor) of toxin-antitoxin stability system
MQTIYKMHQLKTHLSKLVGQVDAGHPVIFGVGGKPQYIITRYEEARGKRGGYGILKKATKTKVEPDLGGWSKEESDAFEKHDPLIST